MSELSTLQRTVANFVEEATGANGTCLGLEAAFDEAQGKYRERFALGGDVGSGR